MVQSSACSVCLGQYIGDKYPVSLPCGHIFCYECIQQLSPKICPIDRQPFEDSDVRRIYNEGEEETPLEKHQSVGDYLAQVTRRINELETSNQQLLQRETEHQVAITALETQNRQLISDHETELNQQREERNL